MKAVYSKSFLFTNRLSVMFIAVLCTALWGNMIPAISVGLSLMGVVQSDIASQILFAGLCFTLSGVFTLLIPCAKSGRIILPNQNVFWDTVLLGFVQTFLQYILLYISLPYTSGFNASIISSSGTFFIIILSHFVYKNDRMDFYKILGCILGLSSAILLNFNSFSLTKSSFTFRGEGVIFLSTLTFVFTTPLCKKISSYEKPIIFTGHSFVIGGLPLIFTGLLGGGGLNFSVCGIAMLIYLSLAACVSGVLWNYLLEYNKVSKVSIYNFLVPIFGAVSSFVMLGEDIFNIKSLIALLLTCLGIYYVEKNQDEKGAVPERLGSGGCANR